MIIQTHKMDHIRIVERDKTDGSISATLADSASDATFRNSGFLGARRRFGEIRFNRVSPVIFSINRVLMNSLPPKVIGENSCLELLVNDMVKMSHPVAKKGAKKKKVASPPKERVEEVAVSPEEVSQSPLTQEVPAATPSPEKVHVDLVGEDPEEIVEKKPHTSFEKVGKENQIVNSFFSGQTVTKPRRLRKASKPAIEESPEKRVEEEEDSEAEWDADEEGEISSDRDAREEDDALKASASSTIRDWSGHEESVLEPEPDDACGDEWNESSAACQKIHVLRALSTKEMASRFHELGLLVLDAPSFSLPASQLAEMRKRSQGHYNAKLEEAREMGVLSSAGSKLKQGEEETVEGFNQRPGGRVDMVGVVDDVSETDWPWTPFVRKVLGRDSALAYTGCVVSRPGDSDQNWHIDGLHVDKMKHQRADRVIVFCPLTELSEATGTTEFVPRSHFLSRRLPNWSRASSMPRARHYVRAGTPIAMDYRLWHRGLRNASTSNRLLLYCVYQKGDAKRAIEDSGFIQEKHKRLKKREVAVDDDE